LPVPHGPNILFRKGLGSEGGLIRPFQFLTVPFRTLLVAMILVDLGFVLLNILAVAAKKAALIAEVPELLKVTHDASLPEDFNYLKWAVIVIALTWLAVRDRWLPPLLWAVVFVMILLDDSLQLHEWIGHEISDKSGLPSNSLLYADDLGEILVFVIMGLVVAALAATLFTQKGAAARVISLRFSLIMVGLGFFGVGVDAVHQMVAHLVENTTLASLLPQILGLIEDGGEMIVGSIAVAITLAADPVHPAVPSADQAKT
jgi:hypothetical protein